MRKLRDGKISTRLLVSQSIVYVSVLALLGLVAGLTWRARAAERSHHATARTALREYAAFAAWQYEREVQSQLSMHLRMSISEVGRLRVARADSLIAPRSLSDGARRCSCGFKDQILFAFRITFPDGRAALDRSAAPGVLSAVERLGPTLRAQAQESTTVATRALSSVPPFAVLRFDTLAGRRVALAYQLVHDDAGAPRAIYGIAADLRHLARDFERVFAELPLLPPALVGRMPNDSVVRLRVAHPVVGHVFATSELPIPDDISVTTALDARLGGMTTTLALQPRVRQALLIQGPPRTALPVYLLMLGIASALALVAMLQVRRARALTRMREQFVANVSHELRTPLAQISMFSETLLLDRERSPQEGRHFLSVIYREARRLSVMVENVLRYSRASANALPSACAQRNIAAEIRDTVEEFAPLVRTNGVTFHTDLSDAIWTRIDRGALRQILLNLLDNAVKFGPRSQTITIRGARTNGVVKVSVEDQGPGIPDADRTRVFEPFTRLAETGHHVAGTGIGLSVVRDLVSAHGGSVWVADPQPNGKSAATGAAVGFSLPASDPLA